MVIELIRRQLAPYGIKIKTKIDKYGIWNSQCHLRLEIRKSLKTTPILLYRADLGRGLLCKADLKDARRQYSAAISTSNRNRLVEAFSALDKVLRHSLVSLPLLLLPAGTFIADHILSDTVYAPGAFIRLRNGVDHVEA